jgi:hypothetical protein
VVSTDGSPLAAWTGLDGDGRLTIPAYGVLTLTVIPEPASAGLFVAAAAWVGSRRRRNA